jgi:L-ribulose-5-phosphate 3-epimerase
MTCPPIGIMQGRLSVPVGGAIQAFPAEHWADEFPAARAAGIACIEWIYDIGEPGVNPLSSDEGIARLKQLQSEYGVGVESVCADYFMPEPLLKGTAEQRAARREHLLWVLQRATLLGANRVILPFVDASKIENQAQGRELAALLEGVLAEAGPDIPEIHIESSLDPAAFAALLAIADFPGIFVNYDSGNSSSLGYNADEEFAAYGARIGSVHIKDRVLGGTTVPLGTGDADFPKLLRNLRAIGCQRPLILQVARGKTGEETDWAAQNRQIVQSWFTPETR